MDVSLGVCGPAVDVVRLRMSLPDRALLASGLASGPGPVGQHPSLGARVEASMGNPLVVTWTRMNNVSLVREPFTPSSVTWVTTRGGGGGGGGKPIFRGTP